MLLPSSARGRAQPGSRPPRLARLDGGLHRRQGPDLPGQPGRLRLQRGGPGHRGSGQRGGRRRGLPGHRLHPRYARPLPTRRRRRPSGRPCLRRNRQKQAQELAAVAGVGPPAPTTSPTRSPLPRWPAPSASARPPCATDCAISVPTRTASSMSPKSAASTTSTTPRPPTRMRPRRPWRLRPDRLDRRRSGQGRELRPTRQKSAKRLRAVVLIGADRALIREALARHAPEVPVVDLDRTDTGAMSAAVRKRHGSHSRGTPY